MSGWIKIDKALIDTIKFRRVARAVRNSNALRGVTDVSEGAAVTVVLGALVRLWIYADTHIADDDSLAITPDEINELVGVEGFAQALPVEWLKVVDPDHVQLPDFHAHNGSSEKLRRNNAKRQADYRHRHSSHNVTRDVTGSNKRNDARREEKRPEEKRPDNTKSAPVGAEIVPRGTFDGWKFVDQRMRPNYPRGTYRGKAWVDASRLIERLVSDDNVDPDAVVESCKEYLAQQQSMGREGSQYVLTPANFLRDDTWRGPFPIPETTTKSASSANRVGYVPDPEDEERVSRRLRPAAGGG